jgi:murein L,D-transpeptidase YafK
MGLRSFGSNLLILIALLFSFSRTSAQDDAQTFRNFQFSFNRVSQAWMKYNDTLKHTFETKGLAYPPYQVYIRSFKSNNEMELWARNNDTSEYKLVKNYRVCALSGVLGPKRTEGDHQVPEGLYFIDDFNPKSDFYLSLLLSYPNYSDMVMGNKEKPGGDIYIHGGCVTIGCLPLTDVFIQELYVLCLNAKINGQNYIPVHIYPTRFDRQGLNFLGRSYKDDVEKQKFWVNLKSAYDYFEKNHKLQPVMYSTDGKYLYQ